MFSERPFSGGLRRLRTRTALQATLNAASTGTVSLLSGVFSALTARHLTTTRFGSVQFALSLLQFIALFFEFGLSLPAARVAARADGPTRHSVVAATLVAFAPMGVLFSAFIFALSFVIDHFSHVHAGSGLRATALIASVYPFQLISSQLCQGLDRLHVSSLTNAIGQMVGVLALVYVILAPGHLTVELALTLRAAGLLFGSAVLIMWLRPRFDHFRPQLTTIVHQAREYGFSVYVGRVLSVATYNMDVLMIGLLASANSVGLYTLADSLARIMLLPTIGATAALFPRMVRQDRIPPLWTRLAWLTGIIGATGLVLVGPYAVDLVFSSRYHGAVSFLVPLGAAEAVRGVTLVYNVFLGAQGRGRELRAAGFILTGSNLVLNLALIPPFGATGAAWASLAALLANLGAHVVYYRRSVNVREARPSDSGGVDGVPELPRPENT